MGRRKDDPLLQAAKGFPGRRKSAVKREIDKVVEAVEKQATVKGSDPFPLPDLFIKQPAYWREATQIWLELSAILKALGRQKPAYRAALARYCVWTQLFNASARELRVALPKGGTTVRVTKGDGNEVYRTHPAIEFMRAAETVLRLLDAEFGFTPLRDNDLIKIETFNSGQGKLPFGDGAAGDNPMGLMDDDVPPAAGVRPH